MTQCNNQADLPQNIAVIMDGNGRWAQKHGLPRVAGHYSGAQVARQLTVAAVDLGIQVLTLYAFSTENWSRSQEEVDYLMNLVEICINRELPDLLINNVRLQLMGRREGLPASVLEVLDDAIQKTRGNTRLTLNIALNYGGRAEIIDAMKAILIDHQNGALDPTTLTETIFTEYLYCPGTPDVDLVIRTSGEWRFSNFLLWRAANAVFWSTPVFWPDFNREHLLEAIEVYYEQTVIRTKTEPIL